MERFTQEHKAELERLKKLTHATAEDITSIINMTRFYILNSFDVCRTCGTQVAKAHAALINWYNSGIFDKKMEENIEFNKKTNETIEQLGLNKPEVVAPITKTKKK